MKKLNFLIVFVFSVLFANVWGQNGGTDCTTAPLIQTTGTTTSNTNAYPGNSGPNSWLKDAVTGSSIENVGFYQFTAAANGIPLEFVVCIPSGCSSSGIQIYLFEQCGTSNGNVLSTLQLCDWCGGTKVSVGSTTFPAAKTETRTGTNGLGHTYTVEYKLGTDYIAGNGKCNWFKVTGLIPGNTYYWGVDGYDGANCPYTIQFTNGISVLATELLTFKAQFQQNGNFIEWITASEINNDYFIVESSTDGFNFKTVGRVDGAGSTKEKNFYSLLDPTFEPTTYYRLKQVDFDGTTTTHPIIVVERTGKNGLLVTPNPVENKLLVNVNVDEAGTYSFGFVNTMGAVVQKQVLLQKGENHIEMDVAEQLASGFYMLRVVNANGELVEQCKFVKK